MRVMIGMLHESIVQSKAGVLASFSSYPNVLLHLEFKV